MRWRWDNDAANYRCCLCLHVNTGSVLLGMFHMVIRVPKMARDADISRVILWFFKGFTYHVT